MAKQSFTALFHGTTLKGSPGTRLAGRDARGYLPAHVDGDKPRDCELYDCLDGTDKETDQPLKPSVAEAAGKTMRPAILDIKVPPPPARRERPAPELQIELELPLGAPDASIPARPTPGSDPAVGRGFAVIDFYI